MPRGRPAEELFGLPPARWCGALNISERTLARLFRSGTGLSFSQWRQRACILHSLQHLTAGMQVTRIAALLGYDNPAAYTAAFKKLLGRPPTAHKPQLITARGHYGSAE